jgi:hypothetical protein
MAAAIAFVLSLVNFYATVYESAMLTAFAGCHWQYGRGVPGLGSQVEYFIVPVTIINEGAKTGTVLDMELVVEKDGVLKSFPANFIGAVVDEKTTLFAPMAIAGHASESNSIVFTQPEPSDPPMFGDKVSFRATVKFQPAVPSAYGFFDHLFASPGADPHFEPVAPVFDGRPARFSVCKRAPDLSKGR